MIKTVPGWLSEHVIRLPGQRVDESAQLLTAGLALPRDIRPRRPKDLPACARLLRVVASEHQYPARWPDAPRSWLAGQDVLDAWVAERQGEILGHVAVATVPRNGISQVRWREITGLESTQLGRVSRLFVRRRVRGQGLASDLLDVAVRDIRARGLLPVLDVVSTSTNGIALVERRGWRLLAMDPWGSKSEHLRVHFYAAPPPGRHTP